MIDPATIGSLIASILAIAGKEALKGTIGKAAKDAYKVLKWAVAQWAAAPDIEALEKAPMSPRPRTAVAKAIDSHPASDKAAVSALAQRLVAELKLEGNVTLEVRRLEVLGDELAARTGKARSHARRESIGGRSSSFFFVLEGKGVHGNQALWGESFDLVFRYDALPADVVGAIKGKKLSALLKTEANLGIEVAPKGLTLPDGIWGRVACFKDGKMIGVPPRFRLEAPRKRAGAENERRGAHITFSIDRAPIYNFFLEIRLVEQLDTSPSTRQVLDLDLEGIVHSKPEPRDARLHITDDGDAWIVGWDIDGHISKSRRSSLNASKLEAAYRRQGILDDLSQIANKPVWNEIDTEFNLPEDLVIQGAVLAFMESAMTAGSKLYRLLSQDHVFKDAVQLIDELPEGSKISIISENVVFPWELLYPLHYDHVRPNANYKPERFWGKRFLIESLLFAGPRGEKLPVQRQQTGSLHVSMGLNSSIDSEWKGRRLLPVQFQKEYCETVLRHRGKYFERYDEIADLLTEPHSGSLIYFFCHGNDTQLEFDKTRPAFTPNSVMDTPYPGWPIIFLNACGAGDVCALSFVSFRTAFRTKKAAGVVAPSFPIPTLFAAVFAKSLLDRYAARWPIGQILFHLRGQLLERNNPLGLWYSLQCPLDVKAPEL